MWVHAHFAKSVAARPYDMKVARPKIWKSQQTLLTPKHVFRHCMDQVFENAEQSNGGKQSQVDYDCGSKFAA